MALPFPSLLPNAGARFPLGELPCDRVRELHQDFDHARASVRALEKKLGQAIGEECYYRRSAIGIGNIDVLISEKHDLQDKLEAVKQDFADTRQAHDDVAMRLKQRKEMLLEELQSHTLQCESYRKECAYLQMGCDAAPLACNTSKTRPEIHMQVIDPKSQVRLSEARQAAIAEQHTEEEALQSLAKVRASFSHWDAITRAELVELERQLLEPVIKITQEIKTIQSEHSRTRERFNEAQRRAETWRGLFDQSVKRVETSKLRAECIADRCKDANEKEGEMHMLLQNKENALHELERQVDLSRTECKHAKRHFQGALAFFVVVLLSILST